MRSKGGVRVQDLDDEKNSRRDAKPAKEKREKYGG